MNIDCVQCNLQILIIWPSKLISHFIYCIVSFLIAYQEGHCLAFEAISKVRVWIVWRLVNEENVAEKK